jgi:hypothetical protein
MSLEFHQRKVVNVHWHKDEIKGGSVSLQANAPEWEEPKEIRNVENDGYAVITFPADFTGECEVTVRGSVGGEETGTVTVH